MITFAGLQRFSLIDHPGNISAIVFTYGCNFRCPYCHNPELVIGRSICPKYSEQNILNFLSNKIEKLDSLVITSSGL
jgi:pyruvate formate lyase activating enzyme